MAAVAVLRMEPLRISKRSQALLDRGRDNPLLHALIQTFGSQVSLSGLLLMKNWADDVAVHQYSDANPSGEEEEAVRKGMERRLTRRFDRRDQLWTS